MKKKPTIKDIINFMKWKAEHLKDVWPDYFTKDDEENLIASGINAVDFFKSIQNTLNRYGMAQFNDCDICPFCFEYFPHCFDCIYGEKHGVCNEGDDEYSLFLEKDKAASLIEFIGVNNVFMYLIKKGLVEYEQPN